MTTCILVPEQLNYDHSTYREPDVLPCCVRDAITIMFTTKARLTQDTRVALPKECGVASLHTQEFFLWKAQLPSSWQLLPAAHAEALMEAVSASCSTSSDDMDKIRYESIVDPDRIEAQPKVFTNVHATPRHLRRIKSYNGRVSSCDDLITEGLNLVKGDADSEDLPLNSSISQVF